MILSLFRQNQTDFFCYYLLNFSKFIEFRS